MSRTRKCRSRIEPASGTDRSVRGLRVSRSFRRLSERVQDIRGFSARVKQPSPPPDDYVVRWLLCCERRGTRMHGEE